MANPQLVKFLNELFDTNNEFALAHDGDFFSHFHDKQSPHLTILKCSDSRVQMDSFDKTPQNDVFVIRNIGNQLSTNEGSVDFGVHVLKTPFLLIIGHSGCGAVETVLSGKKTEIPAIDKELAKMDLEATNMKEAIVENINDQIELALRKYHALVLSGELTIMGAVYDFKDDFGFGQGRVVLTNINGETDRNKIMKKYGPKVKNLHFL
jgi:carbonic anhydrase